MKTLTLIEEIHAEFDTAQDRLLCEANKILSNAPLMEVTPVESVGERLKKLSFVNAPVAKQSDKIKESKIEIKKKLVDTKSEAETIKYYAANYPFLKFLTESELDRICKKYNLVYAPIANYVKNVPEKNITDIENAQPCKRVDEVGIFHFIKITDVYGSMSVLDDLIKKSGNEIKNRTFKSPYKIESNYSAKDILQRSGVRFYNVRSFESIEVDKSGLFIAAPSSHFDKKGLTKNGLGFFNMLRTEVKDPIVFRYVRGGIQVLTKWGEEANDPALVVPVLN